MLFPLYFTSCLLQISSEASLSNLNFFWMDLLASSSATMFHVMIKYQPVTHCNVPRGHTGADDSWNNKAKVT